MAKENTSRPQPRSIDIGRRKSPKLWRVASSSLYGVGTDKPGEAVRIEELRIGPAIRRNWAVQLAPEHDFGSEISLILGEDFFSAVDVEFDFPNRAVRLYQPKDCEGVSLA